MDTSEIFLVEEIRRRFQAASGVADRLSYEELPFEKPQKFEHDDDGVPFKITRLSKTTANVKDIWEIVELDGNYDPHIHDRASGRFYMLKGEGFISLGTTYARYDEASRFTVPKGIPHGFITEGPTVFLSIQDYPIKDLETGITDLRKEEPKKPLPDWVMTSYNRNVQNGKSGPAQR